jgi:hypothetical protein
MDVTMVNVQQLNLTDTNVEIVLNKEVFIAGLIDDDAHKNFIDSIL